MNGLDYLILGIVGLSALHGYARGILRIASSLVALVAAAYCSSIYSRAAGAYFARTFGISAASGDALGYVVIFLGVMILVAWAGGKLAELIRAVHMSWADRLGGSVIGAALGALVAGLMVVAATLTLPADTPALRNSELAPRVLQYTHDLAGFIPSEIRAEYYRRESQVIGYWNAHKATPPEPAPGSAAAP
ncbi:MAG TPA: CvpA family protein [Candidatus Binataceae bacterium]|nr:CvpA family protein [Candidatus Binataceae bacterium]